MKWATKAAEKLRGRGHLDHRQNSKRQIRGDADHGHHNAATVLFVFCFATAPHLPTQHLSTYIRPAYAAGRSVVRACNLSFHLCKGRPYRVWARRAVRVRVPASRKEPAAPSWPRPWADLACPGKATYCAGDAGVVGAGLEAGAATARSSREGSRRVVVAVLEKLHALVICS